MFFKTLNVHYILNVYVLYNINELYINNTNLFLSTIFRWNKSYQI